MTTSSPTSSRPKRVLIVGAVTLNGGDAALLSALRLRLKEAFGEATEIRVAESLPAASRERYPHIDFEPSIGRPREAKELGRPLRGMESRTRRLRFLLAARAARWSKRRFRLARLFVPPGEWAAFAPYLWADTVVMTGGTSLVEHYPLRDRWIGLDLAVWLNRPLVLFTQSLGPFLNSGNQRRMRSVARHARLILLRDQRSLDHLVEIGCSTARAKVSADAAFGLPAPAGSESAVTVPPAIAISVRHWPYGAAVQGRDLTHDYRSTLATLIAALASEPGTHVTLISTCQGDARYWTDDSQEALVIADMLEPETRRSVTVDRQFRTDAQLLETLTEFDLIIATRMHMAILGLVAGRAVLPIAYEFKTTELFAELGASDLSTPLEDVATRLIPTVMRSLSGLAEIQMHLRTGTATQAKLSRQATDALRDSLA